MAEPKVECQSCGKEPDVIFAEHRYDIRYDEKQGKWVKEVGEVLYVCGLCLEDIDACDIEDILRQVDEL